MALWFSVWNFGEHFIEIVNHTIIDAKWCGVPTKKLVLIVTTTHFNHCWPDRVRSQQNRYKTLYSMLQGHLDSEAAEKWNKWWNQGMQSNEPLAKESEFLSFNLLMATSYWLWISVLKVKWGPYNLTSPSAFLRQVSQCNDYRFIWVIGNSLSLSHCIPTEQTRLSQE